MTTKWGILATGRIAHKLADTITESESGELVAVGSRTQEAAESFAKEYGGITAHGDYEDLIDDPNVEAIYISTPHPQHVEWTVSVLNRNKAVLCEKPMGLNHAEVMAMVDAATHTNTLLLEAFMYRMHPQTLKLKELLDEGAVGELRHIHATFAFHAPFNPNSRLYAAELGGGGIMDVGCYPISMVRMIAGTEPLSINATGKLAETGADIYTSALCSFEGGVGAHVATGVGQQLDNTVSVYGSKGSLHIATPWQCPPEWEITIQRGGERTSVSGQSKSAYAYQIDEVNRCLEQGLVESPHMDWQDSLGNAIALDEWRSQMGIVYPQEQAATLAPELISLPAAVDPIPKLEIQGLDKQLSRLVMGCDNQPNLPHATMMFDNFLEAGGNVFDTAYIYGGGRIESLLGQWQSARNVREEIAIIGKGAHTPLNRPEYCREQLEQTLDRLQTDYLDIYFLHRDNVDVPVDEWFDTLSELQSEGLIKVFGGSNWSQERVSSAIDYGKKTGKLGFNVVSNQFSLADMISPVWPGCISAKSTEYRSFLEAEDIALFPWSSQARGFFTSRFDVIQEGLASQTSKQGVHPSDAEMQRCWFSDDNLNRRQRAVELAKKYEVETINIALAFVLSQPFKTFPLIGPRYLWELRSSLYALEVSFEAGEMEWLDLEN